MTPREVIIANIECRCEGRIGLHFTEPSGAFDDMAFAFCDYPFTPETWAEGNMEYITDKWGNVWRRIAGLSAGGEIFQPALRDWKDLDRLPFPDLGNPGYFVDARRLGASETDRFRVGGMPGWVFADARYLRKMEVYFLDLLDHRAYVDELHSRITALYEKVIEQFGRAGMDAIFFCEDLGTQDRTLMSPEMWREVFRPHYERLTSKAHTYGMKVIQHSCGYNWALIDDLCGAGIDCLQFDQPAAYDMPALAAKLRGHGVGLFSPCDIQKMLPTGDRVLIERETERLVHTFRGGFIAKNYSDLHGIGVLPEWSQWAYDTFVRVGAPQLADGWGSPGRLGSSAGT